MAASYTASSYRTSIFSIDDPEGRKRWLELLKTSPQASPFSTVAYGSAAAEYLKLNCRLWFVTGDRGDVVGTLVFSQKKGPFTRVVVPAFTQYTSFIFPPEGNDPEPFMLLLQKLASAYDQLRFHFHPAVEDMRALNWTNWRTDPLYTFQLDLTNYETDHAAWSENPRRIFNKHVDDYDFEERPDLTSQCIELCAAGYARNGRPFPTHPQSIYNLAREMASQHMARTFTVSLRNESSPEAGVVILHDATTAYYWIAGSRPGPAMTVLIGLVLSKLKTSGIQLFDFVGANTPSIAEFKRRFGPKLVQYFAGTNVPSRLLASLLQAKRLIAR